jgi:hypothetical protein
MPTIEWEINHTGPTYMTPSGDIGIKFQVNDIVCLRYNGCEYGVMVKKVDISGENEGVVENHRFTNGNPQVVVDVGIIVNFSFNKIFSIRRSQ